MSSLDLTSYINKPGAKLRFFINYILKKHSLNGTIIDDSILMSINEDEVIASLEAYIPRNATAQITALNFFSNVTTFFNDLNADNGIRCDLFIDSERYRHLNERVKPIVATLRETIPKGTASDDQYESLVTDIHEYVNTFKDKEIYADIDGFHSGNLKMTKNYTLFISVIATKLVLNYALSNQTLTELDLSCIDMVNNTILVNNLCLPLYDDELRRLFDIYLGIRDYIFKLYETEDENRLLIKYNCEPYSKPGKDRKIKSDYMSLFQIMSNSIDSRAAQPFADRRIIELYENGFDLYTLYVMTNKAPEKLFSLVKRNDVDMNKSLINSFITESNNKMHLASKYTICPFCGKATSIYSENWVLVKNEFEDKKQLACRTCKGCR